MVRNAMFQKVQLAARDRFAELGQLETAAAALSDPPAKAVMDAAAWEAALGRLLGRVRDDGRRARGARAGAADHRSLAAGCDARTWTVRQIINDPEGHHDWAIVATVDLDASDAAGEPVIRTQSFASAG